MEGMEKDMMIMEGDIVGAILEEEGKEGGIDC